MSETGAATGVNDLIASYVSNPAFRSAGADELVNETNPFRRPVRAHDLPLLDYSGELAEEDFLGLSSLMGQRMLLNVYEAEFLWLPPDRDPVAWEDFGHFYAPDSVTGGEQVRGPLESYLFGFLDGESEWGNGAGEGAAAVLKALSERLVADDRAKLATIESLADPRSAGIFLLLQLTCSWQATYNALSRGSTGAYPAGEPAVRNFVAGRLDQVSRQDEALASTLQTIGLSAAPRAYWQFYLTSTIARVNFNYMLARDHSRFFELIGALCHQALSDLSLRGIVLPRVESAAEIGSTDGGGPSSPAELEEVSRSFATELIAPLADRYGEAVVVRSVLKGMRAAEALRRLADRDLRQQMLWSDRLDEYRREAERLQNALDRGDLEADLDTFVESEEETSTTHVHDENRLVTVERGTMHFWNNIASRVEMSTGDKLLIPKERLHGSVVLSGECVYHQPIIPDDLIPVLE